MDIKDSIICALKTGRVAQAYDLMFMLDALKVTPVDLSSRLHKRFDNWMTLLAYALRQRNPALFLSAWEARGVDTQYIEAAFFSMNPSHLQRIEERPLSDEHQKALTDAMAEIERLKALKEQEITSEDLEEIMKTRNPIDVLEDLLLGRPLKAPAKEQVPMTPEELKHMQAECAACPPDKKVACTSPFKQPDVPKSKPAPIEPKVEHKPVKKSAKKAVAK